MSIGIRRHKITSQPDGQSSPPLFSHSLAKRFRRGLNDSPADLVAQRRTIHPTGVRKNETSFSETEEVVLQPGCRDGGAASGSPPGWFSRSYWRQWARGVGVGALFLGVSLVTARFLGGLTSAKKQMLPEPGVVGTYSQLLQRHATTDGKPQDLPPLL